MQQNTGTAVPEVTLGEYKGLKTKKSSCPVTDEAVEDQIGQFLDQKASKSEVTGRAAANGDIANIDFEGFADGVAFEGGKGEHVDLEIGSETFIPGFEEQLIGRHPGESFEIGVRFPEGYGGANLSGKDAIFRITLHSLAVKSVPEANDAFAMEIAGVSTMSELRSMVREKLEESAEAKAQQEMLDDLMRQIIAASSFTIADSLVDSEISAMADEYERHLQSRGIGLEQYLEMAGQTMDQFMAAMREPAVMRVKSSLAVKAIAGLEGIDATEAEMEKEYKEISSLYNVPVEELKTKFREEDLLYIKTIIISKKVFTLLLGASVIE